MKNIYTTKIKNNKKEGIFKQILYKMYIIDWKKRLGPQLELDSLESYLSECINSDNNFQTYEEYLDETGYGNGCLYVCFEEFLNNEFLDVDYIKTLIDPDFSNDNKKLYDYYLSLINRF